MKKKYIYIFRQCKLVRKYARKLTASDRTTTQIISKLGFRSMQTPNEVSEPISKMVSGVEMGVVEKTLCRLSMKANTCF